MTNDKQSRFKQSTKGHCRNSNWGKCLLPEKFDEKCIGYEKCEDYEDND
jgi:hypothetical protein